MTKLYAVLFIVATSLSASAQLVYKDVAGIFYNRCTTCHHENQHQQSMLNYSETFPWAHSIQVDLQSGKMPPWPPDTTYTRFLHERIITAAEKNTILSWISSGALKGDTTLAPLAPTYTQYQLNGTPDLILKIPTFTSNATAKDAYNCFAIPSGLSVDRILRAYEIVPGNVSIVHHVVVSVDTTGTVASDLSGTCFNQPGDFGIGGYAPGSSPTVFPGQAPLKMGIRIKAGSKLILQIHYPVGTAGQQDSTQIRLYFYPLSATGIRTVYVNTYLQNWSLSIPANTVKSFTAQYPTSGTLPTAVSIYAPSPHSHKVNKSMLIYAYRTSPVDTIPLISIPNWNFDLQGFYTFPHMVKVPAGYKLFSKHVYDNTTNNPNNPNSPPALVVAGTSTTDEMLFDSFEWMYYQPGDDTINIGKILSVDSLLTTSVAEPKISSPEITSYVFPNPFNENTTLVIMNTNRITNYELKVYNLYGKEVSVDAVRNADGFVISRKNLPSGVYFYSIKAGKSTGSGKIILMPQ
ncbi:MAG: T9SS type A sorting domain-containing protein [Bacteroidia bacterium]